MCLFRHDDGERRTEFSCLGPCPGLREFDQSVPGDNQSAAIYTRPLRIDLFDRDALPGQQGFVDRKVHRGNQHAIRRHALAFVQHHQVARNEFGRGQPGVVTIAPYGRYRRRELPQGGKGLLAPLLLENHQRNAEEREDDQNRPFSHAAQHEIDCGRQQEQDQYRFTGEFGEPLEHRRRLGHRQAIGSELGQPPMRFDT